MITKMRHYYHDKVYRKTLIEYSDKKSKHEILPQRTIDNSFNKDIKKYKNILALYEFTMSEYQEGCVNHVFTSYTKDFLEDGYIPPSKRKRSNKARKPLFNEQDEIIEETPQWRVNPNDDIRMEFNVVDSEFEKYKDNIIGIDSIKRHMINSHKGINMAIIDTYRKYEKPTYFINGVSENNDDIEIFCKLGQIKDSSIIGGNIYNKEVLYELNNELTKKVLYLIGINIMNGNFTLEDVNFTMVYHLYCRVVFHILSDNNAVNLKITYSMLKKTAEKLIKKLIMKNDTRTKSLRDLYSFLSGQFNLGYTGCRFPSNYDKDDKELFKMTNGIERKQHCNSLENKIRECYDNGMKQKDVIKELNVSKAVVSKWYKKFKNN